MALDEKEVDEGINAKVLAGAALVGTGEGVMHAAENEAAAVSKLIEPGDQRHIPHPLDETIAGISGTLRKIATPGDMNLNQSPHPVDDTVNLHQAMVQKTTDTLTEKGLVEGVRIGSAVVATVIVENADPFKKLRVVDTAVRASKTLDIAEIDAIKPVISWNTYEHLLGNGSQPPKLKPLRDFSGSMSYVRPKLYNVTSSLAYVPDLNHKIIMYLEHQWSDGPNPKITHTAMDFLVRVDGKMRTEHGNGSELFHSALKLLSEHGIRVDRIDGNWSRDGSLATNYDAFVSALGQGATVKEAVRHTPTGRWAGDLGFTEVGGGHFNAAVQSHKLPENFRPEFTRPNFGSDPTYNTYGGNWASSQGRSRQDLVPRQSIQDSPKILSTLEQELAVMPNKQADGVWRYIEEHFAKQSEGSR